MVGTKIVAVVGTEARKTYFGSGTSKSCCLFGYTGCGVGGVRAACYHLVLITEQMTGGN